MIPTILVAAQQNMDVTDAKNAAVIFITNLVAYEFGNLLFQIFVGLGTAVLLWVNIYGKVLDNRTKKLNNILKQQQIEDHDAIDKEGSDSEET